MTEAEIKSTLSMLRGAIYSVEAKGQSVDSIRMGVTLSDTIVAYTTDLLINHQDIGKLRTMFGLPVKIDYENPWTLKVLTAVEVPVMRESEVSGNEYDGE